MINEMIVVTVTPFSGTTTSDKNGRGPVMLQCIAGKMPNRNVLSGTVAERQGFEVGNTYLAQVRTRGYDAVFGEDFNFVKIKELIPGEDIVGTCKQLGPPEIISIARPQGFENVYHRKGDAIEGLQTKRAKDGNYEFAIPRQTEHKTAKSVKDGTSVIGATEQQIELSAADLKPDTKKAEQTA